MSAPDRALDKIRWHSRRGLLELDLVLERFNQRHLAALTAEELAGYQDLLALPDPELLSLVLEPNPAPEEGGGACRARLLGWMRAG